MPCGKIALEVQKLSAHQREALEEAARGAPFRLRPIKVGEARRPGNDGLLTPRGVPDCLPCRG